MGNGNGKRQKLIKTLHESSTGGHSGQRACLQRIRNMFYCLGIKKEIVQFIQQCEVCQRNKSEHLPYPSLLQPLPIPTQERAHVTIGFIEKLPCSRGFDTILVALDS